MANLRIIDYFYTCGLDEHSGLEPLCQGSKSSGEKFRLPLNRPYKCRILQHFPEYLPNNTFDAESTSVVTMPNGVSIYTQDQIYAEVDEFPRRHTFVITREDGSRLHGVALVFPVRIEDAGIREAVCSLQDLILRRSDQKCEKYLFDPDKDTLYTLKAFGVLSRFHFIHGLLGWLEDLWASMFLSPCDHDGDCLIESTVRHLLHETKLPSVPGQFVTFPGVFRKHLGYYPAPGKPIGHLIDRMYHVPDAMELPSFEYPLIDILRLIRLDDLLRLLTCVLLEHRIILFSTAYYRLMLVAEGITCLLLPFHWCHVYAPILPLSLVHFVDAPVPYIMGVIQSEVDSPLGNRLKLECHADYSASIELASEINVCYVHIDEGRVIVPDEIPEFPNSDHVKRSLSAILLTAESCCAAGPAPVQPPQIDSALPLVAPIARPRRPDLTIPCRSAGNLVHEQLLSTPSVDSSGEFGLGALPGYDCSTTAVCSDGILEAFGETARKLIRADIASTYSHLLHFNTAVRLVFLRNFAELFRNYEKFLVLDDKPSVHNSPKSGLLAFDKVAFLSDQPEIHLSFLSAFMETQMFSGFVDLCLHRVRDQNAPGQPVSPATSQSTRGTLASTGLQLFEQMITNVVGDAATTTVAHTTTSTAAASAGAPNPWVSTAPLPDLLVHATPNQIRFELCTGGFPPLVIPCHCTINGDCIYTDAVRQVAQATQFRLPTLRRELMVVSLPDAHVTDEAIPAEPPSILPPTSVPIRPSFPAHSAPGSPPGACHPRSKASIGSMSTPIRRVSSATDENSAMDSTTQPEAPSRVLRSLAQSHQLAAIQQSGIAQANWDFIDTLLSECKHRTRRMVLKKMSQEAVELGHVDPNVSVVEENTLVSGLCDHLERVWSHELIRKSGKSALWSHLIHYVRRHHTGSSISPTQLFDHHDSSSTSSSHDEFLSPPMGHNATPSDVAGASITKPSMPALVGATPTGEQPTLPPRRAASSSRIQPDTQANDTPKSMFTQLDWRALTAERLRNTLHKHVSTKSPLFRRLSVSPAVGDADGESTLDLGAVFGRSLFHHSLVDDVLTVRNIRDVKTDIGFARAFVRLALEKKLLSAHLTTLLMDVKLLRKLYSRYAFLRCEEEREQFLLHLLSLNAVDYCSFTRMLSQAQLVYRIYCHTGRRHGFASTTANTWVRVHGHLGATPVITIPRGQRLVEIRHSNLGLLSIVQIGHDNTGSSPRLFVESVLVHNVATNQLYMFRCGHWLGRGVDDDALERLLIGEVVRFTDNGQIILGDEVDSSESVQPSPARMLFPVPVQHVAGPTASDSNDIQERLTGAINRLVKHFVGTQGRPNAASVTYLWCGKGGLVPSLQLLFHFGFRSGRLFQRRFYVWDYIERVAAWFTMESGVFTPKWPPHLMPGATSTRSTTNSDFATHSLPRPSRHRPPRNIGSRTPRVIHASPSLYTLKHWNSGAQRGHACSQPNSPSTLRLHVPAVRLTQDPQHPHFSTEKPPANFVTGVLRESFPMPTAAVIHLVNQIQHVAQTGSRLGKDGRFQCWISRGIRDHCLVQWISLLALSPVTEQMYEAKSFLVDHDLRERAQHVIASLDDFEFPVDPILCGDT